MDYGFSYHVIKILQTLDDGVGEMHIFTLFVI